jgi:F0F1-type ATP synthase membrane subunit b/b'
MIEDQLKSYLESKKEEKDNEASIKVRELRQQLKEELEVSKNETREELSNLFVDTIVEYVRNFVDGRK